MLHASNRKKTVDISKMDIVESLKVGGHKLALTTIKNHQNYDHNFNELLCRAEIERVSNTVHRKIKFQEADHKL